jgi:hypothetical protein
VGCAQAALGELTALGDQWPVLAGQLTRALRQAGEDRLAGAVGGLVVGPSCGCGEGFCRSFHTAPPPRDGYGHGHRTVLLDAPWPGELILDVVDEQIVFVEVIDRPPLD